MDASIQVYVFGGIALVSEVPLPELPRWHGRVPEDCVWIRIGKVPSELPEAVELDPDCFATPSAYLLRIRGIARYLVSDGNKVILEPEEDALPLDVRAYLLATVFVVLCHQRGLLPLHASAIACAHGVIAFLSPSGQGKSSLAAHLARRGFSVVADDICLVDADGEGEAMVIPVAPWLKLWRASLEDLGGQPDGLERVFSEDDKYRLPLPSTEHRRPLRAVIFLERDFPEQEFPEQELLERGLPERDERSARIEMREVTPLEALPMLMTLTHQAYLLEATSQRESNFLRCARVLSQARAYRLLRPWGFAHMEATIETIEKLFREALL